MFSSLSNLSTKLIRSQLLYQLKPLLEQVAPSEDRVRLVRAINPDFIVNSGSGVDDVLSWLKVSISFQPDYQFHLVL
jgi:hypothetical protein